MNSTKKPDSEEKAAIGDDLPGLLSVTDEGGRKWLILQLRKAEEVSHKPKD